MKADTLKERLHESEKLMKEMTLSWEEKLLKTEQVHKVIISMQNCGGTMVSPAQWLCLWLLLEITQLPGEGIAGSHRPLSTDMCLLQATAGRFRHDPIRTIN